MAVYRVKRTRDYTVMSNYHLKNTGLSLKSKGLLSLMLSLPDGWNFNMRGLSSICKEGLVAIGSALKELERSGYMVRNQLRGANGRITDTEHIIYERPQTPEPPAEDDADPDMAVPSAENRPELNIKESNTQRSKTHSFPPPAPSAPPMPLSPAKGNERSLQEAGGNPGADRL